MRSVTLESKSLRYKFTWVFWGVTMAFYKQWTKLMPEFSVLESREMLSCFLSLSV